MLIVVSAVLLVLGLLAYRRNLRPGGSGWLLAVRMFILLLFAAVFVGAVISKVWTVRPRQVAVMLDVSESMSAVKAESAAANAAEAFPLPTGARREEWTFADTAMPEVKGQGSKVKGQNGGATRIGAALATVGKSRPGAVVILSDGQDNGEVDAVAAARELGVPVYAVGFGGQAGRNLSLARVMLPSAVYSGDTVDVLVRVSGAGFAGEKARVQLRGQVKEIALGQATAEQDVSFRVVFDRPGRQVIEARVESLPQESNYADNVRTAVADVKPGRVRVAYVTNRPGPGTRVMLGVLAGNERVEVVREVAVTGSITGEPGQIDVFVLDDVVETGSPDQWSAIAAAVEAGAGVLVLAGPEFQPGANVSKVIGGNVDRAQTGSFTPELTGEGRLLPWWGEGRGTGDLARVPPFAGVRALRSKDEGRSVWLAAQENNVPLLMAMKSGKGRVVYAAGYPLWRWGFGPEERPDQGSPLADLLSGVVRYLSERDTSPFQLEAEKRELYRGQPARLVMRAVTPSGSPWGRLSVLVGVRADSGPTSPMQVPMTETGEGIYEAAIEALAPGGYTAVATVGLSDTVLGRATAQFVVAEQALELANTGMNEGLLRAIAQASGGRFFRSDSLPRDGGEVALGSYQRRFAFDPRRAAWVYVLIALLAGAEWLLRRRRGLL